MSQIIDFEDKNVEKAIERACKELKISREKLRYDIISYGSSGIFGLVGAKKALIRVTPPRNSTPESAQQEQASSNIVVQEGETTGNNDISSLVDEAFGPGPDEAAADETPVVNTPDESETAPIFISGSSQASDDPETNSSPDLPAPSDPEPAVQWTRKFLELSASLISPDTTVYHTINDTTIRFQCREGDSARLIGKRGQTLDAIQHLVDKAVAKQFASGLHVEIDVEDYLDRRKKELTELADRLADKAIQTGKPMVINRINSHDRRVVHLALKENKEIRTQSSGNGDFRKLLILPRKRQAGKKTPKSD